MKLKDWLNVPNPDGSRKRRRDFATAIGVTPITVTQYCEHTIWPGKARMEAILRETKGQVTPNDFLGITCGADQ